MTEIPKPEVDLMPLGTILPFLKAALVHDGYMILQGQTLHHVDYPELVAKMWSRWDSTLNNEWAISAKLFWQSHGGVVTKEFVILPIISYQEVAALAFGVSYLAADSRPVLAIKVRRSVMYDVKASNVDDPNSDA